MSYTVHDTPEVIARIERDLDDITETVRRSDPGLRALVLTGGFARGEGAMRDGEPQNDYDLVALRRPGPSPRATYASMRAHLEWRLGLHIDLAPVSSWRLRFVHPSIFWYETAHTGRVLYGRHDLLERIPVRRAQDLDPQEALRLLTNRSAGLLFATRSQNPDERRLQASKALLAALDTRLFTSGRYAPTHTERWHAWCETHGQNGSRAVDDEAEEWFRWAYEYKVDPDGAGVPDGDDAWRAAARSVREALPIALGHAGFASLDDYAAADRVLDRVYFLPHLMRRPHLWRVAWHPTGHVRVATLRMLLDYLERIEGGSADGDTVSIGRNGDTAWTESGIDELERLRGATLQ